jgi:hypothetical protein
MSRQATRNKIHVLPVGILTLNLEVAKSRQNWGIGAYTLKATSLRAVDGGNTIRCRRFNAYECFLSGRMDILTSRLVKSRAFSRNSYSGMNARSQAIQIHYSYLPMVNL